jgi:hypothetical protein
MPSFRKDYTTAVKNAIRRTETERKRGTQTPGHALPLLPPFWGSGHFKQSAAWFPDRKTCFRRCRPRDAGHADVGGANDAAAGDSVPPDPAHAVTLGGKRRYKTAGTSRRAAPRTPRNNQAAHRGARRNLRLPPLGAGPRAPPSPRLAWPVAPGAAADNAAAGRDAAPGRVHWPDNAGSPASAATAGLPGDRPRCNSGPGDAPARSVAHTP